MPEAARQRRKQSGLTPGRARAEKGPAAPRPTRGRRRFRKALTQPRPSFPGKKDDLVRRVRNTPGAHFRNQLAVVVDFAVEDDDHRAVLVEKRPLVIFRSMIDGACGRALCPARNGCPFHRGRGGAATRSCASARDRRCYARRASPRFQQCRTCQTPMVVGSSDRVRRSERAAGRRRRHRPRPWRRG